MRFGFVHTVRQRSDEVQLMRISREECSRVAASLELFAKRRAGFSAVVTRSKMGLVA